MEIAVIFAAPAMVLFFCIGVSLWDRRFRNEGRRAALIYSKSHSRLEALQAQIEPWAHCPYSAKTDWRKHSEWCRGFEYASLEYFNRD